MKNLLYVHYFLRVRTLHNTHYGEICVRENITTTIIHSFLLIKCLIAAGKRALRPHYICTLIRKFNQESKVVELEIVIVSPLLTKPAFYYDFPPFLNYRIRKS